MPALSVLRAAIRSGGYDEIFSGLYGSGGTDAAKSRMLALSDDFEKEFGAEGDLSLFSAPGRTEIGGNHTDHNRGRVLAGAVNLDIVGLARRTDSPLIRLRSKGFPHNEVSVNDIEPRDERSTSNALIRGLCKGFINLGRHAGGFDAVTSSDVLSGSGLSSSAAFENLVCTVLDSFYGDGDLAPFEIARIGKFAENVYMQKPSGLMDQTAGAVGGFVMMDFKDENAVLVRRVNYDFEKSGHVLCITGPIGSHADLTQEYAAIPREMRAVAAALGADCLRAAAESDFWLRLPQLYKTLPHRALLRAAHFFADDARVPRQAEALERGNFAEFLRLVNESGRSSFMYLQNIHAPDGQGIAVALALSEKLLDGQGAFRVHGGGFAGTVQAFVPLELAERYVEGMERVFGAGTCRKLRIRAAGAVKVL